ncbi:MAG: hypothetical protein K0R85_252 [Devosia sp.]|jgi:hypothetical protein|nr:hypothetical protein [Devosia sp.]
MIHDLQITTTMVKAEAQRRIEAAYPLWRQLNITREGGEDLARMSRAIDAIRAASNRLEAREPIPPDFAADHHWN